MSETWSPFDLPACTQRSPKTGERCVVGGEHDLHGADFFDNWRLDTQSVEWDDGDTIVRGIE